MALANAGIGFLIPASLFIVFALIPIVLIEWPVFAWRLGLPPRRALWVSLAANLVSTFGGALIGVAIDLTLGIATGSAGGTGWQAVLVGLVLMFGITWLIERAVVRRMQPELAPSKAGSVALLANGITYVLLAIASVAFVPGGEPMLARSIMAEVISAAGVEKLEQGEHFQAQGRFNARAQESPTQHTRRILVDEAGRITATIAYPGNRELDGRTIVFVPEMRDGKLAAWHCTVPEAPLKFFPAACRQRGP
jgi:hypothetical protein